MTPVVRDEIGGLITGAEQFRVSVQKDGGLDFSRVHVGQQRGDHPRPLPSRFPVLCRRKQCHALAAGGGFLNDVAQYVVSAVPVDHHQDVDAGAAQRLCDVTHHRVKGHGGDADGPRPGRMLVRAGDRHRRKEVHRVRRRDLPGHGTGDERVGRQRKERTVLLEAPDRKDGDLR
ncbi:hypothetical protein GCM10010276_24550 [Streptomyces longisporus]|uniref:Uncharacterized protein n=1 Tax=Streptomyces longisporus TaxID=1948 RepID=A0ABP5YVF0_STRLO